jgi:methyl-accepting chemotaxis protein
MNIANLRIGTRLTLGFGAICALLVFIVGLSTTMLGHINDGTDEIVNDRMPKIEASNALLAEINDIAIALRNLMLNDDKADQQRQMEEIMSSRRDSATRLQELQRTLRVPKAKELLAQMIEANDKYVKGQDEIIKRIAAGNTDEARTYMYAEVRPILVAYKKAISEQIAMQREITNKAAAAAEQTYSQTRNWLIGLGLAILAFAVIMGYWITASITRPVAKALDIANTVAKGDLTSRIEVKSTDEMGQLLQALRAMNESLVQTVTVVRTGTETIATASSQVASGNQDLSSRTEQQASSLEETASSMEELTSTVKQNADNARQANALAATASTVASKGGQVIGQVVGTMGEINASASKIADIIGVIDGIAFQTNILALNAAVEAARAGEEGRGFAVVATEVRTLAQRSANAAKEIKALIDDSVSKVENGSRLVNEAGTTMHEIVESVQRVADIMQEITAASAEQTSGIEQINQAILQMDQVTQQNASLVEEAAAAAESMQDQAAKLAQTVAVFKLDVQHGGVAGKAVVASAKPKVSPKSAIMPARNATPAHPQPRKTQPAPIANAATNGADWEEF